MNFVKSPLLVLTLGVATLAGCADPYAANGGYNTAGGGYAQQNPRATAGIATGAILGGLLGASSSEDKLEKAVVGATVGGILGGAVGSALDRQAADLRRSIGNDQVSVTNTGSELVVTMPQDILFATDSANLRPDLTRDLGAVAQNLMQYPNSTIAVVGHTDSTGSAAYNQDLSMRRAQSVAGVLIGNGVPSYRVSAIGRGEDQPVASNLTPEGRAQNRRVDIIIRPTN
ncbi:OmpA family protein [Cereibacter sphaeroides]|uniref:OmpA family protein n=1 Tax=Rhodobacterales TaxID=204455 RepID=UPI000BBE67AD|nr:MULTISPECIES: OmpA family protein [Paracoccaceae]MCE6950010.1 OmpA family protein [Cereibacter sphaeroides]MCE6958457.1 OmpA family protein [Cereibacter sphaeroides]MCE6967753.1 OmpA family protein [Cereibacter sphaeroides]MCE6972662.1 OmpA family protein [Cereibacter sphaeroides]